jgi:hypothetical protein
MKVNNTSGNFSFILLQSTKVNGSIDQLAKPKAVNHIRVNALTN